MSLSFKDIKMIILSIFFVWILGIKKIKNIKNRNLSYQCYFLLHRKNELREIFLLIKIAHNMLFFFSTFFKIYLSNCSQVIYFLPNPATLLTTYWISSSPRLNFISYEIFFKSSKLRVYFFSKSTKLNMALLPSRLNGLPNLSVSFLRNV